MAVFRNSLRVPKRKFFRQWWITSSSQALNGIKRWFRTTTAALGRLFNQATHWKPPFCQCFVPRGEVRRKWICKIVGGKNLHFKLRYSRVFGSCVTPQSCCSWPPCGTVQLCLGVSSQITRVKKTDNGFKKGRTRSNYKQMVINKQKNGAWPCTCVKHLGTFLNKKAHHTSLVFTIATQAKVLRKWKRTQAQAQENVFYFLWNKSS